MYYYTHVFFFVLLLSNADLSSFILFHLNITLNTNVYSVKKVCDVENAWITVYPVFVFNTVWENGENIQVFIYLRKSFFVI